MYGAIEIQFSSFAHFCTAKGRLRWPSLPGALVFCATWISGREDTVHVYIPNKYTGVNYQYQNDSGKWSLEMELANRQTNANPYHGFPFYKTAFWKVMNEKFSLMLLWFSWKMTWEKWLFSQLCALLLSYAHWLCHCSINKLLSVLIHHEVSRASLALNIGKLPPIHLNSIFFSLQFLLY